MGAYSGRGRRLVLGAGVGGALPDLPAIGLELWAITARGHSPVDVYRELYFSPAWQSALAPWHSFLLWAALLGVGRTGGFPFLQAVSGSALLHLAVDLPLHAVAPHRHFWPVSDWRFHSPVSSWHPEHYGLLIQPLELALAGALGLYLVRYAPRPIPFLPVVGLWFAWVVQSVIYLTLP